MVAPYTQPLQMTPFHKIYNGRVRGYVSRTVVVQQRVVYVKSTAQLRSWPLALGVLH